MNVGSWLGKTETLLIMFQDLFDCVGGSTYFINILNVKVITFSFEFLFT